MILHGLHIAFNVLDFCALFGLGGLLVSRAWLLPSAVFALPGMYLRWQRMYGLLLFVLTLTSVALLVLRTQEMGGGALAETLPLLPVVLVQTHFGHTWTMHLAMIALLWGGWTACLFRLPSRNWTVSMMLVFVLLTFTYSASSHASDQGDFTLPELNDWLHVLSASIWGGGILATLMLAGTALTKQPQELRHYAGDIFLRLSNMSALALALVLGSGIYNAWLRLGDFASLIDTTYGHLLSAKLIFVDGMILVGAANRFVFVPRVIRWSADTAPLDDRPLRRMFRALALDSVLLILTLLAASLLIHGVPPSSMHGTNAMPVMHVMAGQ